MFKRSERPLRFVARAARGATLVELTIAIVLIGIIGSLAITTIGFLGLRSPDSMIQQQTLSIAQSMLHEVMLQPTGSTDPDGGSEAQGPEAGEQRGHPITPFDHISDYHGLVLNGITLLDGSPVAGLEGYRVEVTVSPAGLDNVPSSGGYWVQVRVQAPAQHELVLSGWRARL